MSRRLDSAFPVLPIRTMAVPLSDKHLARLACCRPDGDPLGCRKTRDALGRVADDPALREAFESQRAFDAPLAAGVQALPLPDDFRATVEDGLRLAGQNTATSWRTMLRQPAGLAALLAVVFLMGWMGWAIYERAMGFPGDENVRQVVNLALKARLGSLEPLDTECGALGDTLFLRHNVTDFDVPEAFIHEMASGYRVFKKDENYVTQVQTRGDGLVFLVFRAEREGVHINPKGTWKHLDGEGWIAAVTVYRHLCFVVVTRGDRQEIDAHLRVARN